VLSTAKATAHSSPVSSDSETKDSIKLIDLCRGSKPLPFERDRKSKGERAQHLARRLGRDTAPTGAPRVKHIHAAQARHGQAACLAFRLSVQNMI
jgi:hypothetical protein